MTEFPRGWDPAAELPRGSDPTVEPDWGWDPTAVSQGLTVDLPLVISLLISMDTAPKHLVSRTSLASSKPEAMGPGKQLENLGAGKVSTLKSQILYNPNFVLFPWGFGNSLTLTHPPHQPPKIPASVQPVQGF